MSDRKIMWFSFWKSRDRFSLDELRYLTDQLQKVQIVNAVNKDFVVEALRSIAELITYGDQHDANFFEFFMEKQVMGEFVRILKISKTFTTSLQLLQTMSIMIQNLKSEHAIYYMFSNEHINFLITYAFDFRNEELLSYYISFLRAISGKLNKNTISLLVKTCNDEVVSFPLYVEAIRFAFHEENMVRIAVRALTLNVYHVGDDSVNRFVTSAPNADYFSDLVKYFLRQCMDLNGLVSATLKQGFFGYLNRRASLDSTTTVIRAVDEIEDNLFYFSDVISAGIPDVGRLITDSILELLILPLLLPSLRIATANDIQIHPVTSLFLLCCILRIVKIKDLSNTVAAALLCPLEAFIPNYEAKPNGHMAGHDFSLESGQSHDDGVTKGDEHLRLTVSAGEIHPEDVITHSYHGQSHVALRESLLSYITTGDDIQVLGSLSVLATFLQTKELDETMLDALGILPQRQQHKKLLLQALVGEGSGEETLFSSESSLTRESTSGGLSGYLQKLKEQYGVSCSFPEVGTSPRVYRFKLLDALVSLFCRSNISAEALWEGGWLLRQLLPYSESEFNSNQLKLLKTFCAQDSYKNCTIALVQESRGAWSDLLLTVLHNEWTKCKKVIEASSPRKELKCMLLPMEKSSFEDVNLSGSSYAAGERMWELVKVFVLRHQLHIFFLGRVLPEWPPIYSPSDVPENSRARNAGLDVLGPKPGAELRLVDAVPCRIAFERGKERHFSFLALSVGTSGWLVLAEELPLKRHYGLVRVSAPLTGCNPKIDDKHPRWLHLRIRPSTLPFVEPSKLVTYEKGKTRALVDGRWTLAFRDEEACKTALSMILEETNLQSSEVERGLKLLLDLERPVDSSDTSSHHPEVASSTTATSNSLVSS
ncbi:protein TRANSPARENT TESTA 9 isoform X2 [Tripterygium wilfordii]|uniref:protein TRANSPARENT TESTA 9 isoform X2 n=1 Tax=Tripterygium wilfordii TaxID=458696 RepID=UPI0018F7E6D3|nr:protein TRANSPARENT TESTA 9 isoform X2 [Tripterygium wilfordii]